MTHDQDYLFVISEVTNLGSYSSSHQGMCRAAPWELCFINKLIGICRETLVKNSRPVHMHGTEEIEEKAIMLGKRHTGYCRARNDEATAASESHPLLPASKLLTDHFPS